MKLLASPTSPFARKVRVVLAEKALSFDWQKLNPWEPSELIQTNPLEQVPALVLDDGQMLCDSLVITRVLELMAPQPALLGVNLAEQITVARVEGLAHGALNAAVAIFLERTKKQISDAGWIERQQGKTQRTLDVLEQQAPQQWWLSSYSVADITVGALIDWLAFRLPELADPSRYLKLYALSQRLNQHCPRYASTHPER